ncbi:MAG: alpha/beta hydrolase [Candidatus Dactylopiibacterium sp.]|nr:alpha/beta hydrolase [Candidatus Dactylopiibacterium sp.]
MKPTDELMTLLTPGAPEIRTALEQFPDALARPSMDWDALLDPIGEALAHGRPDHATPPEASPVILYPGLARDSLAMRPVLRLCRRLGLAPQDWGRGVNMGPTDNVERFMAELAADVQETAFRAGAPVSLVGWSLGGVYAREIARLAPEAVRQVIAIGSPAHYAGDAFGVRWLLRWAARTGRADVRALLALLRRPLRAPFVCLSALADGSVKRLPALA